MFSVSRSLAALVFIEAGSSPDAARVPAGMSSPGEPAPKQWAGAKLAIAALGIVFGDIGTSPLYAMRECFGEHGVAPTAENVLGVLSLMLWSLTLVVAVKYLGFIMRADNQGEGGIFAPGADPPCRDALGDAAADRGGTAGTLRRSAALRGRGHH